MIKISKTFTRPSVDIAWWQDTPEAEQSRALYSSFSMVQSPDGLSFTGTLTYDNEAQYLAFLAEPSAKESIDRRKLYNAINGINEGPTSSVVI